MWLLLLNRGKVKNNWNLDWVTIWVKNLYSLLYYHFSIIIENLYQHEIHYILFLIRQNHILNLPEFSNYVSTYVKLYIVLNEFNRNGTDILFSLINSDLSDNKIKELLHFVIDQLNES